MQKRLAEVVTCMEDSRKALMATVADAGGAFAAVKPAADAWSVAEILAHLANVEAGVAKLVSGSVRWARNNGIPPELSDESVLDCLDEFHVAVPNRKMKAPSMVDVGPGANMRDALQSLETSRAAIRLALADADGLDLTAVKRPHPLLGELNLYQWALLVAHHEERHRKQIEQTLRDVTERAAQCAPIV